MEEALGQRIHWLGKNARISWQQLGEPVPDIFFQSGWAIPSFSALGREVRTAGGAVVALADFCWRGDFRQMVLGPLAFRLRYAREFDAALVAGRSGVRVARHLGFAEERIRTGLLGASSEIFHGGAPLAMRRKELLFVGRLIPLKGIVPMIEAFLRVAPDHPDAALRLCGCGPLAETIAQHPQIIVEEFKQPHDLAALYRGARALVFPSYQEPWGLVVHEAALSGCALVLSEAVGSKDDLAGPDNALLVPPGDVEALSRAMDAVLSWDERRLQAAEVQSRHKARSFGPHRFASSVSELAHFLGAKKLRRTAQSLRDGR